MNQTIIRNWNAKVKPDDIAFYLGDLSFGSFEETNNLVHQLNGKIHYILGNHDKEDDIKALNRFESISDYIHLSVLDKDNPRKYQDIIMSHYAILEWDKGHRGSIMLHGHSHHSLAKDPENASYYKRKVLDVGCNGWDYSPLSYEEIKKIMKDKIISKHH